MTEKELVIIGAGPSGLKAGELASLQDIDYIIFEKGEIAQGWKSLRQNMRLLSPCHPQRDWTSLSGKFPIWQMDVDRPYCTTAQFINYIDAYCEKFNLNVKTQCPVTVIRKNDELFSVETKFETVKCKYILLVTGLFGSPFMPNIPGIIGNPLVLHSHAYKGADAFRRKKVIIIGSGNSAAEIAIDLAGHSLVYLFTRRELKFFSKTKNLCNIRGTYESYLLELIEMGLIRHQANMKPAKVDDNVIYFENGENYDFDHLIFATGFKPMLNSVNIEGFSENELNKLPETTKFGESIKMKNLFFGGPLVQCKKVNTFIHGLIKELPYTIGEIKRRLIKN